MPTKVTVQFRATNADREPARSLIAATLAEGERAYGEPEGGETPSATPAEMAPPEGSFLVAYEGGLPVACGGLKRLDDQTAEIKRMYVVPEARSRGLARSLLSALEEEAARLSSRPARHGASPAPRSRPLRVCGLRRYPRLQPQPVRRLLGREAPLSSAPRGSVG